MKLLSCRNASPIPLIGETWSFRSPNAIIILKDGYSPSAEESKIQEKMRLWYGSLSPGSSVSGVQRVPFTLYATCLCLGQLGTVSGPEPR